MGDEAVDASRLEAAQHLAEDREGPKRQLTGVAGMLASAIAVAMSLLFLYWA
jgi:hypothetical protein